MTKVEPKMTFALVAVRFVRRERIPNNNCPQISFPDNVLSNENIVISFKQRKFLLFNGRLTNILHKLFVKEGEIIEKKLPKIYWNCERQKVRNVPQEQ